MSMKAVTRLEISDHLFFTLTVKIENAINKTIPKVESYPNLIEVKVYFKEQLQEAYQIGLEQGTIEALKVIREELAENE